MPRPNPPPLTAKKAKALYKKSGKKFEFTPSQFRAAERREELEDRRRKEEVKGQRRKESKRKREEKEERERVAKRQQLDQGKIRPEDTWARVAASQPRLNAFFKKPALPAKKISKQLEDDCKTGTENDSEFDSEEETFVDPSAPQLLPPEKVSEEELVQLFSPGHPQQIPDSLPQVHRLEQDSPTNMVPQAQLSVTPTSSPANHTEQQLLDAQLSFSQSFWDFVIAEDNTAEALPSSYQPAPQSTTPATPHKDRASPAKGLRYQCFTSSPLKRKADHLDESCPSPYKSARSTLSAMSLSMVNIRAQEKPDITSAPKPGSNLPSPGQESRPATETPADILAMISTQDLDDYEILTDKENTDPWLSAEKPPLPGNPAVPTPQKAQIFVFQDSKRHPSPEMDDFSDLEDLVDLETGFDDDFGDDSLDDNTLAGLSTQMPAKNTFVSLSGSPKKARFQERRQSPIALPALTRALSSTAMLPPPIKKSAPAAKQSTRLPRIFTKTNSFSFDGVDDADLADLADQFEEQANSQKEGLLPAAKKSRTIPWFHSSQFPPPPQFADKSPDSSLEQDS